MTTSATAPPSSAPPVDIVWIVDASGSGLNAQVKIAGNLAAFADAVTSANIDVHIVMMTTSAALQDICTVTPADPLTGTALASDARYRFVEVPFASNNPLDIAVDNLSAYANLLRPGAITHFVIVSDAESHYRELGSPDERATAFLADMQQLLGHAFVLHTVSSEGPTPCSDPDCMPDSDAGVCSFAMLGCRASAPGTTYYTLAQMTHGLSASICERDWRMFFEPLTAAVIASAPPPCSYQIPSTPSGDSLNPEKVNVSWRAPGVPGPTVFGKTSGSAACMGRLGWFYDADPPTQILLCPATCAALAAGGTLTIGLGCATFELE